MEFCHSYLFVTFVVMTVDQIVGRELFVVFIVTSITCKELHSLFSIS